MRKKKISWKLENTGRKQLFGIGQSDRKTMKGKNNFGYQKIKQLWLLKEKTILTIKGDNNFGY